MDTDIAYHRDRARHELDVGLSAKSLEAARSHLKLSSLHWQRWRELEGSALQKEPPPFVMSGDRAPNPR